MSWDLITIVPRLSRPKSSVSLDAWLSSPPTQRNIVPRYIQQHPHKLTSTHRHPKGWNAPPSGDVEMQLVKQPVAANETSLGGGEGQPTQI